MNDDKFGLVEKIVQDINNVLTKTAELYSFEIIPVDTNCQNKSPVLFLENNLGLESWCVKHVFMNCYTELMDNYCIKTKQKKILKSTDRMIKLLNVTLLLNPEVNVFWNKRRELVSVLVLDKYGELQFTRLVLSRKPKCNEAFMYRRWLLNNILQGENATVDIGNIINEEINICSLASNKSPNNYHSWSHRMWFANKLKQFQKVFDINALYIAEYVFSLKWTSNHISDHSCFHYHQFCIKNIYNLPHQSWKILENKLNLSLREVLVKVLALNFPNDVTIQASEEDLVAYSEENLMKLLLAYTTKNCNCIIDYVLLCRKLEILFHELVINNETIRFYANHETLWYHRRFILHEIIIVMFDHFGLTRHNGALIKKTCKTCNFIDLRQKQAKIVKYDCNRIYSSVLFNVILSHEKKFIEDRRKNDDRYADRHEKYLKFVEGLNSVI